MAQKQLKIKTSNRTQSHVKEWQYLFFYTNQNSKQK